MDTFNIAEVKNKYKAGNTYSTFKEAQGKKGNV